MDALHGRVLAALAQLFDAHKHLVPALGGKTLEVLL